jgi:putative flavoprotein involved in K+ transport
MKGFPVATASDTSISSWLNAFAQALGSGNAAAVAALFQDHGFWRDLVAFGWTIATHEGADAVARFAGEIGSAQISQIAAEAGDDEAFFTFAGPNGPVRGHIRLTDGRCVTLLTTLEAIAGHPEAIGQDRPSGLYEGANGENWQELLAIERSELGVAHQPYVLIVGAGQAGVTLGARLKALGVPALLIDKQPRVGDQWRSRYKSLTLHDPVWYDHLPYMPFPENWPVYTPKDKMGDWLERYAETMELTIWTDCELTGASYDAASGGWTAEVTRAGATVELAPTHLVLALGNAGFPRIPAIAGSADFAGTQYHSSAHKGGEGFAGKRVAIIGANNSAHDIAADLVLGGAAPTLIQRSSTLVVRQKTLNEQLLRPYYSQQAVDSGLDTARADLLSLSVPFRLAEMLQPADWNRIQEIDKPFYDALRAAGFALDFAEDGAGLNMKYHRSASGYYIDVGASEMIIDGRIAVKSGTAIDRLDATGVCMADGSHVDADAIIYATGFGAMEEWIGRLISPEMQTRIGHCWGYGSGFKGDPGPWKGEIRNMWRPTAQEGLWLMAGNLQQCRIFSRYLAQQLKARFENLPIRVVDSLEAAAEPA